VRILTVAEREVSRKVVAEELDLLDSSDDGLVDLLLEGSALLGGDLVCLVVLGLAETGNLVDAEELGVEAALVEGLVLLEELVSDLRAVNTRKVHLGARGQKVGLSNAAERNTVEAERTSHKKKTRLLELLQENNTLASKTACKDDADSAGNKALAELADVGSRNGLGTGLHGALLALGKELVHTVVAGKALLGVALETLTEAEVADHLKYTKKEHNQTTKNNKKKTKSD